MRYSRTQLGRAKKQKKVVTEVGGTKVFAHNRDGQAQKMIELARTWVARDKKCALCKENIETISDAIFAGKEFVNGAAPPIMHKECRARETRNLRAQKARALRRNSVRGDDGIRTVGIDDYRGGV